MKWPFFTSKSFFVESRINRAYSVSLARHGASPQGVFWNSKKSQTARFASLVKMISVHHQSEQPPVIADIGCGYGALLDYLRMRPVVSSWEYRGVDINESMIKLCQERFPADVELFRRGRLPAKTVDYCVFSGTFNLCMTNDLNSWQNYVLEALSTCWRLSRSGMALNLLCRSRASVINNIFYADLKLVLNQLRQHFGEVEIMETPQLRHDMTFLLSK